MRGGHQCRRLSLNLWSNLQLSKIKMLGYDVLAAHSIGSSWLCPQTSTHSVKKISELTPILHSSHGCTCHHSCNKYSHLLIHQNNQSTIKTVLKIKVCRVQTNDDSVQFNEIVLTAIMIKIKKNNNSNKWLKY